MPLSFENAFAAGFVISGTAVLQELLTPPDINHPQIITPNPTAIQREQDAQVEFTWNQTGPLIGSLGAHTWRFDVFLEQMGPNEGPNIPFKLEPYSTTTGFQPSVICKIPKNTVPVGLYRVTARMMLLLGTLIPATALDTNASPMVSFEDLGLVQYYN
jgi:hypothetical protein